MGCQVAVRSFQLHDRLLEENLSVILADIGICVPQLDIRADDLLIDCFGRRHLLSNLKGPFDRSQLVKHVEYPCLSFCLVSSE